MAEAPVIPAAAPTPAPAAVVAPVTPVAVPTPMLGVPPASVPPASTGAPVAPPAVAPVAPAEITFAKLDGFPESEQKIVAAHAKEMGWDQATAQKFHDLQAKHFAGEVAAIEREQAQARNDYVAAIKSDPEFGGTKFDATLVNANKALSLVDPTGELTKHLQATGLDAFPPAVKAFARMGALMAEGKIVVGAPPASSAPKPDHEIFYGPPKK